MTHYIFEPDPFSNNLDKIGAALKPVPGVCIFIDLIDSTADKYRVPKEVWIKKLNNSFNFISIINRFSSFVVKGIGDEVMIYLPDSIFGNKNYFSDYRHLLGELKATLLTLAQHPFPELFYPCKIGLHYCRDAYNISFLPDTVDFYGQDIDAAARMMSQSQTNTLTLSEAFYQILHKEIITAGSSPSRDNLHQQISDIHYLSAKGMPEPFPYRQMILT